MLVVLRPVVLDDDGMPRAEPPTGYAHRVVSTSERSVTTACGLVLVNGLDQATELYLPPRRVPLPPCPECEP